MSGESGDNIIGIRTVYDALLRLEGKLDEQAKHFDTELDGVKGQLDVVKNEQTYLRGKTDGSLAMVKWLGPTGVAALGYALLKAGGFIP